ncbi:hypothetical protein Agau_P200519 (plasmid) [Agrobacterium tumefaciens F2]|nr:hypothetical protein Agau_P200519 [Agrobacterium tumefaciens F2]
MVAIVIFLFAVSGRSIAASMAVAKAGDDRTAPKGPEQRGGRRGDTFLFREEWRREPAGDESFAEPLRDQERGEAVLRSDLPHRARLWSPFQTGKGI